MKLNELVEALKAGQVEINGQVISVGDEDEVNIHPTIETLAAQALDDLDVDKIIRVMEALDWKVVTNRVLEIPDEDHIYKTAESLIKDAIDGARSTECETYSAETMGLRVEVSGELDWIRISFVAVESQSEL